MREDVVLRLVGYSEEEISRMSDNEKLEKVNALRDFAVEVIERLNEVEVE